MHSDIAILASAVGYLVGAVSSARIIIRLFGKGQKVVEDTELSLKGTDEKMVLKTVSASSVSVQLGSTYGFLTYVCDMLKVIVPVLFFKLWFTEQPYFLLTAFFALVGHVWPVYYTFRGGRGLSVIYATILVIDWMGFFATSIPGMVIGLVVLKDMLCAYVLGVLFIIPWLWFRTHNVYYLLFAVAANIVFLLAMLPEIKRWITVRRDRQWGDPAQAMQLSGMGRGLLQMAKKLGLYKQQQEEER